MFICLPGVNSDPWPKDVSKLFATNYPNKQCSHPWNDYLYLRIEGCTFSGDPYTTVRNTIASLLYGYMYAFMAGIPSPWCDDRVCTIAAGDDLVMWSSIDISTSIFECTSTIKEGIKGIGQCIKEVCVSYYDDFIFCSKWVFPGMYMVRDVNKLVNTKQYYSGSNDLIH
jgi:hypothetical protein